ncbi:MAG TPA: NUDIX domain-containing protein [Streptosporangiaceae bacterium]
MAAVGQLGIVSGQPCHLDFQPRNWLIGRQGGVSVVDFEHARIDLPARDLVCLRFRLWPGRPDLRDAFLDGYGGPLSPAEDRLTWHLGALDALTAFARGYENADADLVAVGRDTAPPAHASRTSLSSSLGAIMTDRYRSIVDVHMIPRREGKILLLHRAGNVYATGMFCLPSGHLEDGENVLNAAVREAKEETGIALDPAALRLALSIHERHPGTTHARIGFAFEPASWHGEPVNAEPEKCSELLWADPVRLPPDTVG